MSLENDKEFRDYLASSKNVYAEVKHVMKLARDKLQECNYKILASEALTWAVQGVEPDYIKEDDYISKYERSTLNEMCCYIEDKGICDALEASYIESKLANYLIYNYKGIEDEYRQTRVRILVRMLYYNTSYI